MGNRTSAVSALGAAGPDEQRMLREAQEARDTQLRAPVSEQQWQSLLLHPSLRGSLGQLMGLIFMQGCSRYAADLGDFKLHPKKHRIELSEARDPAVNNLRHIARSLGFEGLNVYSPFLASRITGKADKHPDEAVAVRVNPTAPLSIFVGEPLLREADLPALTAQLAATLCVLRPELSMAVLLRPEEISPGAPYGYVFLVGEVVKLASIAGLLVAAHFLYRDLHWGGLLTGVILALQANFLVFGTRT